MPATSNGVDAVNFRNLRESSSLQFETQGVAGAGVGGVAGTAGLAGLAGADGTEGGPDAAGEGERDLFGAFSSVTLKYDGEEP